MATIAWDRIREGIGARAAAPEDSLRRVRVRLAAQTVILLLVMLMALEVVVYVRMQQLSIESLEDTLKGRTHTTPGLICYTFRTVCALPGPGRLPGQPQAGFERNGVGPQDGLRPPRFRPDFGPSDASAAWVNRHLRIVHPDGPLGNRLLDPQAVRQALRGQKVPCCSTHEYRGQDFLVYTKTVRANGKIVGAVQAVISKNQYDRTMRTLLQILLVATLLGLAGSGGISVVLVRRALQPIRVAMQRQRDFVADAAHELRTPLAIMRTAGEIGLNDQNSDDQQATIEQMLAENRHLTRLVDDLSLLARADSQTVSIERRPVDLSSLVRDTIAELSPLAEGQEVSLTSEAQGNLLVLGDVVRLRQLLLILVDNALKYTPPGGTVRVQLSQQGGRARLQVIDSGPGIDPTDLPRIFDRFYRADQARTGEGSGLGLAIGKWIADAHGGSIQAANAAPHGAVLTVTLPLARASALS